MYRVLIIDDNHSFIDSLKVLMQGYPFQIESTYKYIEARKLLEKHGPYFNWGEIDNIANFELEQKEGKKAKANSETSLDTPDLKILEKPVLSNLPITQGGYALIVVEYDTETGTKGTQFIHDLLINQPNWKTDNFMLLTTKLSKMEALAKKINVPVFEKPIKHNLIKSLLQQKIQYWKQVESTTNKIIEDYNLLETETTKSKKKK
jgi:hypothetical protein